MAITINIIKHNLKVMMWNLRASYREIKGWTLSDDEFNDFRVKADASFKDIIYMMVGKGWVPPEHVNATLNFMLDKLNTPMFTSDEDRIMWHAMRVNCISVADYLNLFDLIHYRLSSKPHMLELTSGHPTLEAQVSRFAGARNSLYMRTSGSLFTSVVHKPMHAVNYIDFLREVEASTATPVSQTLPMKPQPQVFIG